MKIEFKSAGKSDVPLIHELGNKAFQAAYKDILAPAQIAYMLDLMYSVQNVEKQMGDGHFYEIAYADSEPCGYVSVQRDSPSVWHLQKIYLLSEFKKKGIGKLLFLHAVEKIKEFNGVPCRMSLNVNRSNPAVEFYRHMGMFKTAEGDFPIGNGFFMNDYIMSLDLM